MLPARHVETLIEFREPEEEEDAPFKRHTLRCGIFGAHTYMTGGADVFVAVQVTLDQLNYPKTGDFTFLLRNFITTG